MDAHQLENQNLRRQLQSLMDEARVNEQKWRRLDQLEKQLIATRTLPELIQVILTSYKSTSETDAITLVLSDPEGEIKRILELENQGEAEVPGLVLLEKLYADDAEPYLGTFDTEHPRAIFDPWPSDCLSMILLPLMRQQKLIGSLNLASCKAERFTADNSTDFLERLANIFTICLENSLNHERLKQVGFTDPLTGIYNRRYFETRCQEEVANIRRYRVPLSCMFLDIDKFKRINDTFGHPTGDEVLQNVAGQIKSQLRSNDILARFGGEEFVVLLPQTGLQHASEIAERIRHTIASQPFHSSQDKDLAVTISIGVASTQKILEEDDSSIAKRLLSLSDEALYLAKKNGRNRVISEEDVMSNGKKRSLINLLGFN